MAEIKATAAFKSIEIFREEQKIPDAVFEGVKAANGWKAGRQVEETVFKSAVEDFLNAPIDGRAMDGEAKG